MNEPARPVVEFYSASALMEADLPEPTWVLPGLLPEGVTLLVGPPKRGKSFFALGLAVQVAAGSVALGAIPTNQGAVLYAALEDSPRRVKKRLQALLGEATVPPDLHFTHRLPRGEEMIDILDSWLNEHPQARLVIIDVLGKIAKVNRNNEHSYHAAYDTISPLKELADRYSVAFLVVHHTRKSHDEGNPFNDVSGSSGWVGSADTVMVLQRAHNTQQAVLHLTGRDVEESTWTLTFDPEHGRWTVSDGPSWLSSMSDSRRGIYDYLCEHGPSTPKEIADGLPAMQLGTVQKTVRRMAEDGQLQTDGTGLYTATAVSTESVLSTEATPEAMTAVPLPQNADGPEIVCVSPMSAASARQTKSDPESAGPTSMHSDLDDAAAEAVPAMSARDDSKEGASQEADGTSQKSPASASRKLRVVRTSSTSERAT